MSKKKQKIFVVEDDPSWQLNYTDILGADGYEYDFASSYEEALAKFNGKLHLILIVDLRLVDEEEDNEDGVAVLKSIADKNPKVNFIICTGYGTEERIEELSNEYSIIGWIDKNEFKGEKLIKMLRSIKND